MTAEEFLIRKGIEKLGVTKERILSMAEAMEAAELGEGYMSIGFALQALQWGTFDKWVENILPDSIMIQTFVPKVKKYLEERQDDFLQNSD